MSGALAGCHSAADRKMAEEKRIKAGTLTARKWGEDILPTTGIRDVGHICQSLRFERFVFIFLP
jgi:hypothetical protein